jgi:hypothetical protein
LFPPATQADAEIANAKIRRPEVMELPRTDTILDVPGEEKSLIFIGNWKAEIAL